MAEVNRGSRNDAGRVVPASTINIVGRLNTILRNSATFLANREKQQSLPKATRAVSRMSRQLSQWRDEITDDSGVNPDKLVPAGMQRDSSQIFQEVDVRLFDLQQALAAVWNLNEQKYLDKNALFQTAANVGSEQSARQLDTIGFCMSQLERILSAAQEDEGSEDSADDENDDSFDIGNPSALPNPDLSSRPELRQGAFAQDSSLEQPSRQQDSTRNLPYWYDSGSRWIYQHPVQVAQSSGKAVRKYEPPNQVRYSASTSALPSMNDIHDQNRPSVVLQQPVNSSFDWVARPFPALSGERGYTFQNPQLQAAMQHLDNNLRELDDSLQHLRVEPQQIHDRSRLRQHPTTIVTALPHHVRQSHDDQQSLFDEKVLYYEHPSFHFRIKPFIATNGRIEDITIASQPLPDHFSTFKCGPSGIEVVSGGYTASLESFTTTSVFFDSRRFWVARQDILATASRNPQERLNWEPLGFSLHDQKRQISRLTTGGSRRLHFERVDQQWPLFLLPPDYRSERVSTHSTRNGGLIGELGLIVALMAFSVEASHVQVQLCKLKHFLHTEYRQEAMGRSGQGWTSGRGAVVEIWFDPNETTAEEIQKLQDGGFPRIFA